MQARNAPPASLSAVDEDRVPRESVIDFEKLVGQSVFVELQGGRRVTGTLRGHDHLSNMVLENAVETLSVRDGSTRDRSLGSVVVRGTQVSCVAPAAGMVEISNPFPLHD